LTQEKFLSQIKETNKFKKSEKIVFNKVALEKNRIKECCQSLR